MALEPDRHREIIPTSYFATGNGGNGRNEGGNGRNGRNEKMEEIVAETASRIYKCVIFLEISMTELQGKSVEFFLYQHLCKSFHCT